MLPPRARLRPVRTAICLIALGLVTAAPMAAQSDAGSSAVRMPTLGDASDLTSAAERRLGDSIAREIYRDPEYLDDPVVMDYVNGIWQPLLAAARCHLHSPSPPGHPGIPDRGRFHAQYCPPD